MTQFQIVLQGIFGDLLTILVIPVVVAILVVVTIKDKGTPMMDDDENKPAIVNFRAYVLAIVMSLGLWLVLIAVGYLLIQWAGR